MVDVLLQVGPEGRVQRANDAVHGKLGYAEGEVVGQPVDYVFADPDENEQLADMMTDGALLDRLLTAGHVTDLEVSFETADGEVVPMSLSASVMYDDGGLAGIVCVAKDISERVAAQRRAEFLHSLLRHDLGNALQVIGMNLQLAARESDGLPPGVTERIESAREGVEDATELIEDVRRLNRLDEVDPDPVRLDEVVADAVDRTTDLAEHRDMTVETDVDTASAVGGPMLRELVANLVENALVHSGGSLVRVETRPGEQRVRLVVADDGRGIPESERERISEKGYSTGNSRGSGLGMYLVERIAESYGATFQVGEASLGGARFTVGLRRSGDDGDGHGRPADE